MSIPFEMPRTENQTPMSRVISVLQLCNEKWGYSTFGQHKITYSPEKNALRLSILDGGRWRTFFLEEGDLDNPLALIQGIDRLMKETDNGSHD